MLHKISNIFILSGVTVAFIQEPLNWINLEDGMRQYNDK